MKRILFGCGIVQKELEDAVKRYGIDDLDIFWFEGGLHNNPQTLRDALQEKIDATTDYDEIILGYGLCGNALLGISATNCDILYPKTDDCISALMCENCRMSELRRNSFFTSRGWLSENAEDQYTADYNRMVEKFDEETAKELMDDIYAAYKNLVYMQTEEVISEEDMAKAKEKASVMGLELVFEPATITLYEKLIRGDETYEGVKRLRKGEMLAVKDFMN